MHSLPKLLVARRLGLRVTVRVGGGGRGRDKGMDFFPFFPFDCLQTPLSCSPDLRTGLTSVDTAMSITTCSNMMQV